MEWRGLKTKTGRIVLTLMRQLRRGRTGNRIGLISVCTDMERKQAEEALRQQTERERLVEIAQRIRQSLSLRGS